MLNLLLTKSIQKRFTSRLSRLGELKEKLTNGPSISEILNNNKNNDNQNNIKKNNSKKPSWLRSKAPSGKNYEHLRSTVKRLNLSTVCEEAMCPNIGECWGGGKHETATATIMLMGDTCTRACRFCSIKTSRKPSPLDEKEPEKVAEAISNWGLDYVVMTSVDRDDLNDGGAAHIAKTVKLLKQSSNVKVEVLTPDFSGDENAVKVIVESGLDVFAHNIETVEGMTKYVRDRRANYRQSLKVLAAAKKFKPKIFTKSSIMLGVGETSKEIEKTLDDLKSIGVEIVTFGQYLRPTKRQMKVQRYVPPNEFEHWKKVAKKKKVPTATLR